MSQILKNLTITSMAATGHGIGSVDEKNVHVLGTFIGDTINAKIYKQAEGITYAEISRIISASPDRTHTPHSTPFYTANVPWEFLNIEAEQKYKQQFIQQAFLREAGTEVNSEFSLDSALRTDHYRNKVAYSFMRDANSNLAFAMYSRGTAGVTKTAHVENILVHETLNKVGKQFLNFLNQKSISLDLLKYLILRYSYHTKTVVASLLLTETSRKKLPFKKSDLEKFMGHVTELQGIVVSSSPAGVRSAMAEKDFYQIGEIDIIEEMNGKIYKYHPSLFFQIYPDAFSMILSDVQTITAEIIEKPEFPIIDLFAGVGVIGLSLADLTKQVTGVELSARSGEYAIENAQLNEIENFSFIEASVDDALDSINSDQILIVDPPRSGLTKPTIQKIMEEQPQWIVYISCNPETQARDFAELKNHYDLKWSRGYNLFPKTHHVENLIVLSIKN